MQIGTSMLWKPCSKNTNPIFDITDAILQLDVLTLLERFSLYMLNFILETDCNINYSTNYLTFLASKWFYLNLKFVLSN